MAGDFNAPDLKWKLGRPVGAKILIEKFQCCMICKNEINELMNNFHKIPG